MDSLCAIVLSFRSRIALSAYLTQEFGRGFSRTNVANMRKFYLAYRDRQAEIVQSSMIVVVAVDSMPSASLLVSPPHSTTNVDFCTIKVFPTT